MTKVRVPGFTPSSSGLHFANAFSSAPFWRVALTSLVRVEVGDVANGLCGGMSYLVTDLHRAGTQPPPDTTAPPEGSALRALVKRRQLDSFDRGRLPLRIYSLMSPLRPARESGATRLLGRLGIDLHSRAHVMIAREWPAIRRDLDAGRLVSIGLVRVVSANPLALTRNHQVLAWGYDLDDGRLELRIYDPNWPDDDDVTIGLDVADPDGDAAPAYSRADGPVVAFFRAPYRPARPAR
jgi:hypothetical protein